MTAHGLDTANSCRRRYWLSHVNGWQSEPFNIGKNSSSAIDEEEQKDRSNGEDLENMVIGWPSATSFGSMFHRLVEIGLANPAKIKSKNSELGPVWLNAQKNQLLSDKEIDDAIQSQPEWHRLSKKSNRNSIKNRSTCNIAYKWLLGRMVDGEEINDCNIEGLRTEASFYFDYEIDFEGLARLPLVQLNEPYVTRIDTSKYSSRAKQISHWQVFKEINHGCRLSI